MATELGQAYVQIMPSAKGISGSMSNMLNPEAESAGNSAGLKIGSALKVAAIAGVVATGAALGKLISSSLSEGADLQQSLGGVETLFKDNADKVKKYATEGYKTAGMSANAYMETVTGFSASMIKSLNGDTAKAADLSNQAIVDMSDNANKMGTNIGDIQNAYQGFAKQNYTMLDNLKLGYGGTKEEMQRLLTDAQKLTGQKYDISNFSDITQAIHAIQTEMDITGTTAKEAATTFSGSFNSMKAAMSNVLGNLSLGRDLQGPLNALVSTTSTFLFKNFIPMVGNIFKALPGAISTLVSSAGKEIASNLGIGVGSGMSGFGEKITKTLAPVTDGFKTAFGQLPSLFQTVVSAVTPVISKIGTAFTKLDFSGIQSLVSSVIPAIQNGFSTMWAIVSPALDGFINSFVGLWNAAQPLITVLSGALMPVFQVIGSFVGGVLSGVLKGLSGTFDVLKGAITFLTPVINVVINVFKAIVPALSVVAQWIGTAIGLFGSFGGAGNTLKSLMSSAWSGIKNVISVAASGINGVINVIKTIFSGLGSAGNVLKSVISTVWSGIRSAISTAGNVINSIVNGIKSVFGAFGSAGNVLKSTISSAWSGIKGAVSTAAKPIEGIVNGIKKVFNSLGDIDLLGAGKAVIDGFIGGLTGAWEKGKEFIGGIGDWIKKHKGPISYDRKILIPAGQAIMGGFNDSLMENFKAVQKNVSGMAKQIQSAINDEIDTNILNDDSWDSALNIGSNSNIIAAQKIAGNIPVDALNQEQSKTEIHAPMTVVVKENPSEREIARQQQLQWQKAAYDF
ncbi:phage tail protein [Lactococcus lactis]|uniref:phage tail protein n=1 Tax=Lactococcus lactis TaxID=1358 RepID=UPI0018A9735A|nr:phage tail protein [Lactococcus lactis]